MWPICFFEDSSVARVQGVNKHPSKVVNAAMNVDHEVTLVALPPFSLLGTSFE